MAEMHRFSSRRQRLDHAFLANRLKGAKSYKRIAGYFRSSIFELVGEEIADIPRVQIVCNSELDAADVVVSKHVRETALKERWNEAPAEVEALLHKDRYRRLHGLLTSGRVEIRVVPKDRVFVHGKAGVIEAADGSKTCFLGSINETKVISQNEYPGSICSGRLNQNVPFGQKRMAFQACFHRPHRRLAQRHTFFIHFAAELDNRMHPFPRHPLGPLQHRLRIDQLGAIPMQFHHPPTALNRIVLAMIGWVVQELDRLADGIDKLHHALEKLCPHTIAFRAVVQFDLHPIDPALLHGAQSLPPRCQRIDDEITRFIGTAKGHIQLRRVFVDDPTWDIFFLAPQVMITGFVITTGVPPARERANINCGFTVQAQAFDLLRVLSRVVFFLYWQRWHRWP